MSDTLRTAWPAAAAMLGLLALAAGAAWIVTARKAAAENQSPWPQPVELPAASASSKTSDAPLDAPEAAPMCPLPNANANSAEEFPAMTPAHENTSPAPAAVPSKPGQVQSATFALG